MADEPDDEEEKMFHENPLVLGGHIHKQIKINSTDRAFLVMIQPVTELGTGNK